MAKTLRILHAADFHLDAPFTGCGFTREQMLQRRADLLANFQKVISLSRDRQADLVCFAGDMFEEEYVSQSTIKRLFAGIAELDPLPVLISPGNHDPFHTASPYATEELPINLRIFRHDQIEKHEFPDIGAVVYGLAFTAAHESRSLLKNFRVDDKGESTTHILLCHGAVTEGEPGRESDFLPIENSHLKDSGAHYCALGHYHSAQDVWEDESGLRAAYPGSPEPLRYGHTGDHGVLFVEIDSASRKINVERIVTQKRRYFRKDVNLGELESVNEIDRAISTELGTPEWKGHLVELQLSGAIPPELHLRQADYSDASEYLFALRFVDNTYPDYDVGSIAGEKTARGVFCRKLLERLNKVDLEEKEKIGQALWLGLAAFDGHDVEELPL